MKFKTFARWGLFTLALPNVLLGIAACGEKTTPAPTPIPADALIITNGTVIDGTGADPIPEGLTHDAELATAGPLAVDGSLIRELRVQADDVTLHVRVAGNPEAGNVLLAIHGGPGNASDYMVSLERLASAEFAVVTYDQRGTGRSTEPADGYAMVNYVADLEAVRQAVGTESVHLLGHSWGGLVAMRYAVAHQQRVSSIILVGSGVLTQEAFQAGQAHRARRITTLQEQGVIPQTITSLTDILPAYFSDPDFDMPDELKDMYYNPAVEQSTWATLDNYDFSAELDRLDRPVLVLWGADDPFGMAYVEATRRVLSAAAVDVVVLEKCGHYWHECPDEFFPRVRAFLKLSES